MQLGAARADEGEASSAFSDRRSCPGGRSGWPGNPCLARASMCSSTTRCPCQRGLTVDGIGVRINQRFLRMRPVLGQLTADRDGDPRRTGASRRWISKYAKARNATSLTYSVAGTSDGMARQLQTATASCGARRGPRVVWRRGVREVRRASRSCGNSTVRSCDLAAPAVSA